MLLEVRSLTRVSLGKIMVLLFLLESPGEDLFSCIFQLLEAAAFLGLWPLPVFKTNNGW